MIIFPFFNPLLFFFLYFSNILICSPSPLLFPLFFFYPSTIVPSVLPVSTLCCLYSSPLFCRVPSSALLFLSRLFSSLTPCCFSFHSHIFSLSHLTSFSSSLLHHPRLFLSSRLFRFPRPFSVLLFTIHSSFLFSVLLFFPLLLCEIHNM